LILDQNKRVVGKLSHLHVLCALEPKQDKANSFQELDQFGFSSNFIRQLHKQRRQQAAP
jgi:hypothetical protein